MSDSYSELEVSALRRFAAKASAEQLAKRLLVLFLVLLPFQALPKTFLASRGPSMFLSAASYSDEVVFVGSLFIVLSFLLIKPQTYKIIKLPLNKFIWAFLLTGLVSLWVNGVRPAQGLFGLYDVIKNLLVLHVFSTLRFSRGELVRIVGLLKNVAVFIAAAGIIAELLALFFGLGIGQLVVGERRLGFYRVLSLSGTGNQVYLSIYMTLFFFLALATPTRTGKKFLQLFSLLTCLLLTMSKGAWLCLAAMMILVRSRLRPLGVLFLPLAGLFALQAVPQFEPSTYFRSFGLLESLRLVKENPVLGVGPGMFGGLASVLFRSPLYNQWPESFRNIVFEIRSIDAFWPQLWAEFGLLGMVPYVGIWVSLFLLLRRTAKQLNKTDPTIAAMGRVLHYFLIPLAIMGAAAGLNAAFVTFTYFALVGMWLSYGLRENYDHPSSQ